MEKAGFHFGVHLYVALSSAASVMTRENACCFDRRRGGKAAPSGCRFWRSAAPLETHTTQNRTGRLCVLKCGVTDSHAFTGLSWTAGIFKCCNYVCGSTRTPQSFRVWRHDTGRLVNIRHRVVVVTSLCTPRCSAVRGGRCVDGKRILQSACREQKV